jgi:hypothetical protein
MKAIIECSVGELEVTKCTDCPFLEGGRGGAWKCEMDSTIDGIKIASEIPDTCPLKDMSVLVKLKSRKTRDAAILAWVKEHRYWLGNCGVGPQPLNELRRIAGVHIEEEDMGKEW